MTMLFADRVAHLEAEGAYAVLAHAQALEAQGKEVLHLEIGQPDFPTPDSIREAGVMAIRTGKTRYNPPAGLNQLREVIAREEGMRRGIEIEPRQIVVGPGAKPGLFFTALALIQPGDEVMYPDPGFPTYAAMIRVSGGIPVPVPLNESRSFSFDLEAFDRLINPRTKLVILNSPANPTGGVISGDDLHYIAQRIQQLGCWVLSDEIYSRLVYDGVSAPSIASLDGMLERSIVVDGFSKTYAMTGWRLGYAIMPTSLAKRVELLLTHSVGCTATFTQYAGIEALSGEQSHVNEVIMEYQRRRDRIVAGLNAIQRISCQKPEGAFYVFPNVSSFGLTSNELARRLLDEAGVAVLAGTDFGSEGEGYLRLCFATSMQVIDKALEKMSLFFNNI